MTEPLDLPSPVEITIDPHAWAKVSDSDRLRYLKVCRQNLGQVAKAWVEMEAHLRGHYSGSTAGAESWMLGPVPTARTLRYLESGLRTGGTLPLPAHSASTPDRLISKVFPFGWLESLLFLGFRADVWSKHRSERVAEPAAGPALVLGASNVSSICTTDVLAKLFCENRAVVCKVPLRFEALVPVFNAVFDPLIRDRHVQFVCGGAELGQALLADEIFESVHLTGAASTFAAIQKNNTVSQRTFTGELGCVTPTIVAPGRWSSKELVYQARHLASLLTLNGGYNCVTPQVLVLSSDWQQKEQFINELRHQLELASPRDDLFFGAAERRQMFRQEYPDGTIYGPRTLLQLDPDQDQLMFQEEAFCGMLGWVELDPAKGSFLDLAVSFCNERLWGDLSCLLLVDPRYRKSHGQDLQAAVDALRYGTVTINVSAGLCFATGVTPWGSFNGGDGHTGKGWVHNLFFLNDPEKTVAQGPFRPPVPLPWLKPFSELYEFGQHLFEFEQKPSVWSLLACSWAYSQSVWAQRKELV